MTVTIASDSPFVISQTTFATGTSEQIDLATLPTVAISGDATLVP